MQFLLQKPLSYKLFSVGFIIAAGVMLSGCSSGGTKNITQESFSKILTVQGTDAQQSKEFDIASKRIKFRYACTEGPVVCLARLRQVGGEANEIIFRSVGSSGPAGGEETLDVGPGKFYIEMDTHDRQYTVDVLESSIKATTEAQSNANKAISDAERYRSINGFDLTGENKVLSDSYFDYKTRDQKYSIQLTVAPPRESDLDFSLEEQEQNIAGIKVTTVFAEDFTKNGTQLQQAYEAEEFVFTIGESQYTGFVRRTDGSVDKLGISSTTVEFVQNLIDAINR